MARKYSILNGTIDGNNTVFTLPGSETYVPNSPILIWNGLSIHETDDNGFIETSPNTITMKIPPILGDVLMLFYDNGQIENAVFNMTLTTSATNYRIDVDSFQYSIDYSVNLGQIDYNSTSFTLTYNTNTIEVD